MADKLKMYVFAVGQGSCGLVCHYDASDTLVQLDLCDCGRTGGILGSSLKKQMALIHGLMAARASGMEGVDLYLDHIIISHKDTDHLNLFTKRFFLEGCIPSLHADKPLEGGRRRRSRGISQSALSGTADGSELVSERDYRILMIEAEYNMLGVETTSVGYEWENCKECQKWHSTLTYNQKYDHEAGGTPLITKPFIYCIYLGTGEPPIQNNLQCSFFSLLLDTFPESGSIAWQVSSNIRILDEHDEEMDEEFSFVLSISQPDSSSIPIISLDLQPPQQDTDTDLSLFLSEQPIAFNWDMNFLDVLHQLTQKCFQLLLDEILPEIFPEIDPEFGELLCQCVIWIQELYNQAFQQMSNELSPMFAMFSNISDKAICDKLFGASSTPCNSRTLAVGQIFVGGLELARGTSIAKNVIKMLSTFCPQDIQPVNGMVQGANGIRLIQMPLSIDCRDMFAVSMGSSVMESYKSFSSLPHTYEYHFLTPTEFNWMLPEENSQSIMYMAPDGNGYRAVFPGDATGDTMLFFLSDIVPLLAEEKIQLGETWLCAPHHGSWTTCENSSVPDAPTPLKNYLQALSPNCVLTSAGFPNAYHHPRGEFFETVYAFLEEKPSVTPHRTMFFDLKEAAWMLPLTGRAVHSTVWGMDNDSSIAIYYVNLSIKTGDQEVTVEDRVQAQPESLGRVIPYRAADLPSSLEQHTARPPRGDAFPFLFDEPFIAGTPAL